LVLYICTHPLIYGFIDKLTQTNPRGKLWIMHGE
jgi:hypothetical protein